MCGIYGFYRFDGAPADAAWLPPMGNVTAHRGPDDEGQYVEGPCAIGMRRLSIIDLAGGRQPLSSTDGKYWLVCNGEIYNYRELRRDLEARGHRFKTRSDCEVLLGLYREYGEDFLQHVNGMYAFALWDGERQRLLIGRDRLGVKPLYLYRDERLIAFASEAKALLALPGVRPALDPAALDAYLHLGYVPAPQSMFRGMEKLPPATLMRIEDAGVHARRYWEPPQDIDRALSEQDWIEAVRTKLEAAVARQMVSDVPIGAFLSGGIDSSAVAAFMARHSDRPVKTYAIGFEGEGAERYYNELPYARRMAQHLGTEHREILVRPDVVRLLPQLVWHMDEPIADTAFITTYLVSAFAREDVTVILSGVGGDELFGGYRRYLGHRYQQHFDRLPGWLRQAAVSVARKLPADRHSPLLDWSRYAKGFLAGANESFENRYRRYVEVFPPDSAYALRRVNGVPRRDALGEAFARAASGDSLHRMLVVDLATQLPDDLLLLTDKMSMATSLECRVPLLDHELVELAARIPEDIKIRGGRLKHLMKQALAGVLPPDILERRKRGFGAPMGAWLKRQLAPVLDELLSEEAVRARGIFDPQAVRRLITDHEASRTDGTDRLLALMNLEIWARIYLDGREPERVAEELQAVAA